jgi:hypothetical protein
VAFELRIRGQEFVRYRLGPGFDFINRLRIRYERAVGTRSLLDRFFTLTRARQIGEDIRKILAYGEAVLFGVLVLIISPALPSTSCESRGFRSAPSCCSFSSSASRRGAS